MKTIKCPKGHGPMELKRVKKEISFKGVDIAVEAEAYVCRKCGLEAGTPQTAGALQRAIADAYRAKQNRLTSEEIKNLRKSCNLTQHQLAEKMRVGIASIKRWETGTVQSASMDHALRMHLQRGIQGNNYSGNRKVSLSRIKLVIRQLEELIGKELIEEGDQFLYLGKYLWYADFLCFRQLGRSMTGASYAALPYGPQLNNYRDLIDLIKASDEKEAELLSDDELLILKQVVVKFPEERLVYEAAHREKTWRDAETGALIPYACANELSEI